MPKRLIPVSSLTSVVVLLLMLNFTTPTGVGPLGVLVFFIAVYVLMFGIFTLIVRFFGRILGHKPSRKQYLYSVVLAFGPIMLLLAQSLGSINFLTISLVAVFEFLACFLIKKRSER